VFVVELPGTAPGSSSSFSLFQRYILFI